MSPEESRPALRVVEHADVAPSAGRRPADWESIYRETAVLIYRYIYARVGNRPDAEDLTTQVFMRALPRLRLTAAIEEIRSYLVTTARTVLADHWRDYYDAQLAELDEDLANPVHIDVRPADEEVGVRRANEILAELPDHYRRVLELRFLRGYSLRETAEEIGITVTNAKVIQFRALRRAATMSGEVD
jgi:RNA polymerase sigma-70 factor (ECF subfamily)